MGVFFPIFDKIRFFEGRAAMTQKSFSSMHGIALPKTRESYPLNIGGVDTLVAHCSDPRFQEAFQLFILEELELKPGSYDPIVIPGASQLLTFADSFPKFASGFTRSMEFLVKAHHLKRTVIIMHEDCLWYSDFVPTFVTRHMNPRDRQISDLLKTKKLIEEKFPRRMQIEMFYASIQPPDRVTFSEIKEGK